MEDLRRQKRGIGAVSMVLMTLLAMPQTLNAQSLKSQILNMQTLKTGPSDGQSLDVPSSCAVPTAVNGHNTYYIDPVKGSMSGDGSSAHPWHTLAEVFDFRNHLIANAAAVYVAGVGVVQPNPNAPIKSGDTLYLMSGNHGNASLQGYFGATNNQLDGYNNTAFITVAAAPKQTPIIQQLSLTGVGKWLFQGLTFQSLFNVPSNNGQPYTSTFGQDYFLAGLAGPNNNVIFDHDIFQSQASVTGWTVSDFLNKRVSGITETSGTCLTLTNNLFQNIGFAIGSQRSDFVLIRHNVIDTFTDDGIDYGSNDMVIDGNFVTNSIDDGDGFHRDAMQGQPVNNDIPVVNVQITNNYIVNQTNAQLVSPASLDGIDAFDGTFQNVTIYNNIVIIDSYHGIAFAGAQNISIINNTVIGTLTQLGQGITTWITIGPSKTGNPSQNVTVRNNIAALFPETSPSIAFDHNIIATMNPNYIQYFTPSPGVAAALLTTSVFKGFQPAGSSYDPRLLKSPAVGGGAANLAPRLDIRGYARGKIIDLGAVTYGGPPVTSLQ